jgi:putative transposase
MPFWDPWRATLIRRRVRWRNLDSLPELFVFNERHLRQILSEYVGYFNHWRPHRSIGQRAPCALSPTVQRNEGGNIIAKPVLGGLHHIYQLAA